MLVQHRHAASAGGWAEINFCYELTCSTLPITLEAKPAGKSDFSPPFRSMSLSRRPRQELFPGGPKAPPVSVDDPVVIAPECGIH